MSGVWLSRTVSRVWSATNRVGRLEALGQAFVPGRHRTEPTLTGVCRRRHCRVTERRHDVATGRIHGRELLFLPLSSSSRYGARSAYPPRFASSAEGCISGAPDLNKQASRVSSHENEAGRGWIMADRAAENPGERPGCEKLRSWQSGRDARSGFIRYREGGTDWKTCGELSRGIARPMTSGVRPQGR